MDVVCLSAVTGARFSASCRMTVSLSGPVSQSVLVHGHVQDPVEDRLHCVRDATHDEDRCRAHVGNVPERQAAISNMAISLIKLDGRLGYVPPVGRHFAAWVPGG